MPISSEAFMTSAQERDEALRAYARIAFLPIGEERQSRMNALPERVSGQVESLFRINACPTCGSPRHPSDFL